MMDCKKCVTHNGRSLVDHECFRDFPNPELVSSSEKTMNLSSEQSDERLDLKTTDLFLHFGRFHINFSNHACSSTKK